MKRLLFVAVLSWVAVISLPVVAQRGADVDVTGAWARPTVAGQMGTGAFMRLTSKDGARVVGASSEAAGVVEIHEMAMDGNVMRMRAVSSLDLPAGVVVELKPGGYHMMLMDLKRTLAEGEKVKVDLRLQTRDKKLVTQPVEIDIRSRAP